VNPGLFLCTAKPLMKLKRLLLLIVLLMPFAIEQIPVYGEPVHTEPPSATDIWFHAMDSLLNTLHDSGGLEEFRQSAEMNGDGVLSLYALGKIAMLNRDYPTAAYYFHRTEPLVDGEVEAARKLLHFNYALTLAHLNKADECIAQYLKALRIDPVWPAANFNIALAYYHKGDYASAREHMRDVLRFEPHFEGAKEYLAQLEAME
jgi:tetratricopeptide (TPR) repeat protein